MLYGSEIMAEHEPSIGKSSEWYTPKWLFESLGVTFDLDPCSPGKNHWVPAKQIYTKDDDGLRKPWRGFVFMNPPFGGRNAHVPWLSKFIKHGNGIAIVRAYTSAAWFHKYAVLSDAMLFPNGKTKFIRPDGSVGKSPGSGVVLLAMGNKAVNALRDSSIGFFVEAPYNHAFHSDPSGR